MKFGHNLPRNQVPEWGSAYLDYKGLKKLIKTQAVKREPDLAGKSSALDTPARHRANRGACRILLLPRP